MEYIPQKQRQNPDGCTRLLFELSAATEIKGSCSSDLTGLAGGLLVAMR